MRVSPSIPNLHRGELAPRSFGAIGKAGAVTAPPRAPREPAVVSWATSLEDVRQAQRLRYDVFREMGANIDTWLPGHDVDRFDDFCEHLIVRDGHAGDVIGTYRVLTPTQAQRAGGLYSETEFDLSPLHHLRPGMVELGRSCVHPDHRQGGVMLVLWGALAEFMARHKLDTMIGCASIPMMQGGIDCGGVAASLWRRLSATHLAPAEYHVCPHRPLPVGELDASQQVDPPALIRGYLRVGAKVLGPPAWDPDFNTADLPMFLRVQDLPERYRRLFAS